MAGYSVVDVANQSLDAMSWPLVLGDIQDGSHEAQVLLRAYSLCRKQLLRAANWSFARKTAPMTLLADASGNTKNVGTRVPNTWFIYEYALPTDCLRPRFVPWNPSSQAQVVPPGNISTPVNVPLTTGQIAPFVGMQIRAAQFTVEMDFNYPPTPGQDLDSVEGVSPQARTVICTNVRNAELVYTADMLYPNNWDPLFRSAMVAYLGAECCAAIWSKKDPKMGLSIQDRLVQNLKSKVIEARVADGNAGGPEKSDIRVDWMDARRTGGAWNGGAAGWGSGGGWGAGYGGGYDGLPLPSGSYF